MRDWKYNSGYDLIEAYVDTDEPWSKCPNCDLVPKTWTFDNGRSTGCGCHNDTYDHFSIYAESISSVQHRTGRTADYSCSDLRDNWEYWVKTEVQGFVKPKGGRADGKW